MDLLKIKNLFKSSAAPFFKGRYEGEGQIIVLHRIIPASGTFRIRNSGIEITPEHLEQLIKFFKKRNYNFISLDELPNYLQGSKNKKFVVFTLDDGYIDNLTYAYPIFKKYNVPFTVYVTTNFPDRKAVLWWYLLEDLLLEEDNISFNLGTENIELKATSYTEKEKAFNHLRNLIKSKELKEQFLIFDALFTSKNIPLYQKVEEMAMSWDEIRQLNNDSLVTIAAHTVTHPSFKILNEDKIIKEVQDSVNIIESKLNTKINHFAYPYGAKADVGQDEVAALSKTSIVTATTGREGNIMKEHIEYLHALPRLYVGPKTTEQDLVDYVSGKTPFIKGAKTRVVTI